MLVIRLSRTGRTKKPTYRVVVADKRAAADGKYIEVLGHYDPRTKDLTIKEDRAKERLAQGAQPSETAEMLLERAGVLKRAPITEQNRRPVQQPKKAAEDEDVSTVGAAATSGDAPGNPAETKAVSTKVPTEEPEADTTTEVPAKESAGDAAEKPEETAAAEPKEKPET